MTKMTRNIWGQEKDGSGRRVFREHNGRFRQATLGDVIGTEVDICPNCGHLNPREIKPVYHDGFISPLSMRPQHFKICPHCGWDVETERTLQQAMNDYMAEG